VKKLLFLLLFVSGVAHAGAHAFYDFSSHSYIVENNRHEVRSIASITKLFTAVTVLNSGVDLSEKVKVNGRSRGHVPSGVLMTRMDLMRAMLISSDNRAAETLANHHPGGFNQFIRETFVNRNPVTFGELKMREYEDTDLDFAEFTADDDRALADMDREIRTEARRAQIREALEGGQQ
jgi:D-alanyl-D-alanine endopeptidase (penicillin-binding protein 7)